MGNLLWRGGDISLSPPDLSHIGATPVPSSKEKAGERNDGLPTPYPGPNSHLGEGCLGCWAYGYVLIPWEFLQPNPISLEQKWR